MTTASWAQHTILSKWAPRNLDTYDKRIFTYGLQGSIHSNTFRIRYSDQFVTSKLDTVHSVDSPFSPGFTFGFLVNRRLHDQLDLRIMPQAGFYNYKIIYRYTNKATERLLLESTLLEFPVMLKYKSVRRGNVRMYLGGGFTMAFQLGGKKTAESVSSKLDISKQNLTVDTAMGFDFYYPYFKFSMELRFSKGLVNMLQSKGSAYDSPIESIKTQIIGVYFIFQ